MKEGYCVKILSDDECDNIVIQYFLLFLRVIYLTLISCNSC